MYSRIVGASPLRTMEGITAVISRSEAKGASTVAVCSSLGCSFTVTSVTSAERALGSDDELGEVVAGRRLDELPARAHDLARPEHHLEAEDVGPCHAVADGPHPAGVRGDVAAERRALLAGLHGVDEALWAAAPRRARTG